MTSIFVFGSNLAGQHWGGAARHAHEVHGAEWGIGEGHSGNAYALPTCDRTASPLPLAEIKPHIDAFIAYVEANPALRFNLTRIGCGIAGYDWDTEIRPLFPAELPSNITLLRPIVRHS